MFSDGDGTVAVRTARAASEAETEGKLYDAILPQPFSENMGVFVTISEHPSHDLRACIGYPEPIMPLRDALVLAARGACHDPRFPPLTLDEARSCVFEVTLLTPPEKIHYKGSEDLMSQIVLGKDGLIASRGPNRGLLLPQVPDEWGWNIKEYLDAVCTKAGMRSDAWMSGSVKFEKFQGEIFSERLPGGPVERVSQ